MLIVTVQIHNVLYKLSYESVNNIHRIDFMSNNILYIENFSETSVQFSNKK